MNGSLGFFFPPYAMLARLASSRLARLAGPTAGPTAGLRFVVLFARRVVAVAVLTVSPGTTTGENTLGWYLLGRYR